MNEVKTKEINSVLKLKKIEAIQNLTSKRYT